MFSLFSWTKTPFEIRRTKLEDYFRMESSRVDQLRELFNDWSEYELTYAKNLANLVSEYQKIIDSQEKSSRTNSLPLNYLKFLVSVLEITSHSHETYSTQISQAKFSPEKDYRTTITEKSRKLLEEVDSMQGKRTDLEKEISELIKSGVNCEELESSRLDQTIQANSSFHTNSGQAKDTQNPNLQKLSNARRSYISLLHHSKSADMQISKLALEFQNCYQGEIKQSIVHFAAMLKNVEFDLQAILSRLDSASQNIESDILEKTSRRNKRTQVGSESPGPGTPDNMPSPVGDLSLTFPPQDTTLVENNIYPAFENYMATLTDLLGEEKALSLPCVNANFSATVIEKIHSLFFPKPALNLYSSFISPRPPEHSSPKIWDTVLTLPILQQVVSLFDMMGSSEYSIKQVYPVNETTLEQIWQFSKKLLDDIQSQRGEPPLKLHILSARLIFATQDIQVTWKQTSLSKLYISHRITKDTQFWTAALSMLVDKLIAEGTRRPIPSKYLLLSKCVETNGPSMQQCLSSGQIQTVLEAVVEEVLSDTGKSGVGGLRISGAKTQAKLLLKPDDIQ